MLLLVYDCLILVVPVAFVVLVHVVVLCAGDVAGYVGVDGDDAGVMVCCYGGCCMCCGIAGRGGGGAGVVMFVVYDVGWRIGAAGVGCDMVMYVLRVVLRWCQLRWRCCCW